MALYSSSDRFCCSLNIIADLFLCLSDHGLGSVPHIEAYMANLLPFSIASLSVPVIRKAASV